MMEFRVNPFNNVEPARGQLAALEFTTGIIRRYGLLRAWSMAESAVTISEAAAGVSCRVFNRVVVLSSTQVCSVGQFMLYSRKLVENMGALMKWQC
jgi:hypothetical protein